ncbi:hypothetical protein ACFYUK_24815 [Nonomuraea wenchangensis]
MDIVIGRSRESDHLLIPVLGRSFPGSADAELERVHEQAGGSRCEFGRGTLREICSCC